MGTGPISSKLPFAERLLPFTLLLSISSSCSEKHTNKYWATTPITIIKHDNQTGSSQPAVGPEKTRSPPQDKLSLYVSCTETSDSKGWKEKGCLITFHRQSHHLGWILPLDKTSPSYLNSISEFGTIKEYRIRIISLKVHRFNGWTPKFNIWVL